MPAVRLWGRRWHFSSDVVPIPAAVCGVFHAIWVLFLLIGAIATGEWPSDCQTATGRQYMAVFAGLFASFVFNLVLEVLLFIHGMRGAPGRDRNNEMGLTWFLCKGAMRGAATLGVGGGG